MKTSKNNFQIYEISIFGDVNNFLNIQKPTLFGVGFSRFIFKFI